MDLILFLILAVVAIISALGLLLSKNAIYAALYLILNFATVAIFFLLLNAPFIALVQITVYAGAIMVLFLFVIMLLGAERLGAQSTLPLQRPVAIALAVILLVEAVYLLITRAGSLAQAAGAEPAGFGSPAILGNVLFNQYLLPFEVTSILLLVAMLGAIVLTKPKKARRGRMDTRIDT